MANGDTPGIEELNAITVELEKQAELRAKISKLQGLDVSKLDIEIEKLNARTAITVEQIELLKEDEDIRKKVIQSLLDQLEIDENNFRITKQAAKEKRAYLEKIQQLNKDETQNLTKQLEKQQELTNQSSKRLNVQKGGRAATRAMAQDMAQLVGFGRSYTTQLTKALMTGMKFRDVFKELGASFKESFGPAGIISFFVKNTFQQALLLDQAIASFSRITGASGDFSGTIEESFRQTSSFATSLQETSQAASDLFVSYNSFTKLAESSRVSLTASAAALQKIGMNAQTTGEILNFLEYSLGITGDQLNKFPEILARTAIGLGVAPSNLQAQFASLTPELALFGSNGMKVFSKVANAAKQMGFSTRTGTMDLFNLTKGMDEFGSAADKVASLNLILGGSFINTFDLVMSASKGPLAQLKLIEDGFRSAGRNIDDLSFFERKHLVDAMGISFDKLQKLLRGEITEEEAMVSSQEEMTKAIKSSVDMLAEIRAAIAALAGPFGKILKAMTPVVEAFASIVESGGSTVMTLGLIGAAFIRLSNSIEAVNTKLATTSVASQKAGLHLSRAARFAGGMGLGMVGDSAMQAAGVEKDNRFLAGLGTFALGGALMFAPIPGARAIGMTLMSAGAGSTIGTAMSPDVSRQPGGGIRPGQNAKTHTGELMVINAPGSGAEVFSQKAMTNYTNALREHTRAVSSDSGTSQMSEMTKELKKINNNLSSGANEKPIQVSLVLDRRGQEILYSDTINRIKKDFNPDGSGRMST